ncbi:hypothetical protein [Pusillimonas noertemannii]|uniref:Uncharacterized protein n=1 Tax=Pusillimonas noertemannii TaxID=305977 RepID=A0A2U1CRE1_9BURK|nr:hypothetical protein [Pusillimonas noertemannii]NYT67768.1 hypothetical protein [Pusillimonas noertemannii]PVY68439.1 hypothetical protein C7440_0839 [Pusillimonas noertemannii]
MSRSIAFCMLLIGIVHNSAGCDGSRIVAEDATGRVMDALHDSFFTVRRC